MRWSQLLVMLVAALVWSTAAQAVPQFVPTGTARLHTLGSGQPGAEWDTTGAGSQVAYDSGTQVLTVTAGLNTMNWYDPSNGSCSADVGTNCAFNFGPDLDITLSASLDSLVVTPLGGGFFDVTVNFGSGGGVDLSITDPADGNSTQLEASLVAGTFLGAPTTGLSASVVYDSGSGTVFSGLTGNAFFMVDAGTPFASLFLPDAFGISLSSFFGFDDGSGGDLAAILAAAIGSGSLGSFTAEANGQVFATATGEFVPEPGIALLLGLAGLVVAGRRR